MRSLCIILLLLYSLSSSSQDYNKVSDTPDSYFCRVEAEAYTNYSDWKNFLIETLGPPLDSLVEWNVIPNGEYKVWFRFIVDRDGSLKDIMAEEDPYGLGQMAVDAAKRYPNKWIPAEQNGRKVKAYRRQSIIYQIEGEKVDSIAEEVCHSLATVVLEEIRLKARSYPLLPDDTAIIEVINVDSECNCAEPPLPEPITEVVEVMPDPPLENDSLQNHSCTEAAYTDWFQWEMHLWNFINLDSMVREVPAGTHKVIVGFVVEKDGKLSHVQLMNYGFGLEKLFYKSIQSYRGNWQPALLHGQPIRYYREQWMFIHRTEDGETTIRFETPDMHPSPTWY
jgi:hypothetical protein